MWQVTRWFGMALSVCLAVSACNRETGSPNAETFERPLKSALAAVGLNEQALSQPKLDFAYSTTGRLRAVDVAMETPAGMIPLSRRMTRPEPGASAAAYISLLLASYDVQVPVPGDGAFALRPAREVWAEMAEAAARPGTVGRPPSEWDRDTPLFRALRVLLFEEAAARRAYRAAGGNPTGDELRAIQDHLIGLIRKPEPRPEGERWLMQRAYHQIGARADVAAFAAALARLQAAVEHALPDLRWAAETAPAKTMEWRTPLGRVRVAGHGSDRHTGDFLLLIDLGGNDTYAEVGYSPALNASNIGGVSVVIDLAGDDRVRWRQTAGPGAGVFGINLWADLAGNDRYEGGNLGQGAALLGAGLLWDMSGNDAYSGGAMVQGVGQYGIGALIDGGGHDVYQAQMASQGFGGPGGIGLLAELDGHDRYSCGGVVPDRSPARRRRHVGAHYISMCQGFALGIRDHASGGIGLLLDRDGDDRYQVDIFGQGSAYWFGVGMLVDRRGHDLYRCFEHCQGDAVHLSVGLLADWGGNDEYAGHEHAQGVGLDRATGILYDDAGDDIYRSDYESQGSGLKSFGAGVLIDAAGNDRYEAIVDSQGYSARPDDFPIEQWPLGILLDLGGANVFEQPGVAAADARGRIQNRRGVAVAK